MIQSVSGSLAENHYEIGNNLSNSQLLQAPKTDEKDSFEHTQQKQDVLPCDNYNQIITHSKTKIMELQLNFTRERELLAWDTMNQLYSGTIGEEELKGAFEDCCNIYLKMLMETGEDVTSEKAREDAIMHAYVSLQHANTTYAVYDCDMKGMQIAKSYGYTGNQNKDFLYYDADHYYKNDSIRQTLTGIVQSMFDTYHIDQNAEKKVNEADKNTHVEGGMTFNSLWANRARYGANICTVSEPLGAPPEGFQFFYKVRQNPSIIDVNGDITLDSQKGIIIVGNKEKVWNIDIPFNNSTGLGKLAGLFNAGELYQKELEYQLDIFDFLKNFTIYTRTHSFIHFGL